MLGWQIRGRASLSKTTIQAQCTSISQYNESDQFLTLSA